MRLQNQSNHSTLTTTDARTKTPLIIGDDKQTLIMLSASLQKQQKRLYQISYRSSNLTRHLLPLQSSDKFDINVAIIRSVTRTLRKATASLQSPRFLLKGRVHVCRVRSHRHKMSHAKGQCLCHSLTELRQSLEECKFEISLGIKLPGPGVCK